MITRLIDRAMRVCPGGVWIAAAALAWLGLAAIWIALVLR